MAERRYDQQHRRVAAELLAAQPWCTWCRATTDLVADHLVPARPEFGYQVLCRVCNTRRRNGATGPTRRHV